MGVRSRTIVAWVAGLACLVPTAARAEEEDARALMREIFAAFATLVTHVDDPEDFASPDAHDEIMGSFRALERNAHRLEAHMGRGPLTPAHEAVGRSLADDVARARDRFAEEHYESARFLAGQLVEDCFACHSKLPSGHRFALGAQLLEREPVASLPPERKALVAVAARQFDEALTLHEVFLADPSRSAVEIALSGAFESYLKVALRVRGDRERALATLSRFLDRGDLPFYLREEVETWIATLRAVDPTASGGLAGARELVAAARLRTAHPADRRGLVYFVVASRWLHEHAARPDLSADGRAETLLWLGLCEIHISSSLWVSEAEWFLEGAIREAPGTAHARTAYGILESVYVEGYSGSGGTYLPPEIERRLEDLRGLATGDREAPR